MSGSHRFDRRSFLRTTAVAVTAGGFAGCTGSGTDDAISIGALQPLSGPFAAWGQVYKAGLEFGIDEINDDGGVLDRELRAEEADTGSDPSEGDTVFRRFVERDDVVAAVGPVSSDLGIRTARTAEELQVPLLLHMAGSNDVITPDTTYTFRVGLLPAMSTMRAQGQMVADAGYSTVGAIIGDYAWGRSIEAGIETFFDVDVQVRAAPYDSSEFGSHIRQFPDDLEMMIATGHPVGCLDIADQLYALGYEPAVITGPGFPPEVVVDSLGDNAFRGFTDLHNTDVYADEFAAVAQRFGEAEGEQFTYQTAYGYVTAGLVARAIADAGSTDPTAIRDALRGVEFDTLFAEPIRYSEFGELHGQSQIYSRLVDGSPEYLSAGEFDYVEQFRSAPLPAIDPED